MSRRHLRPCKSHYLANEHGRFSDGGPSQADNRTLFNSLTVSKRIHSLAVAQLYRCFHHTFSDFEDRTGHGLTDRLASILETLVTSEANYAQYIKGIYMDTVFVGDAGERACREYSYEYSCGKYLNTLLLAVLKKIPLLETF